MNDEDARDLRPVRAQATAPLVADGSDAPDGHGAVSA
jgi:hypothetical protein